jgi:hypothetical protein
MIADILFDKAGDDQDETGNREYTRPAFGIINRIRMKIYSLARGLIRAWVICIPPGLGEGATSGLTRRSSYFGASAIPAEWQS